MGFALAPGACAVFPSAHFSSGGTHDGFHTILRIRNVPIGVGLESVPIAIGYDSVTVSPSRSVSVRCERSARSVRGPSATLAAVESTDCARGELAAAINAAQLWAIATTSPRPCPSKRFDALVFSDIVTATLSRVIGESPDPAKGQATFQLFALLGAGDPRCPPDVAQHARAGGEPIRDEGLVLRSDGLCVERMRFVDLVHAFDFAVRRLEILNDRAPEVGEHLRGGVHASQYVIHGDVRVHVFAFHPRVEAPIGCIPVRVWTSPAVELNGRVRGIRPVGNVVTKDAGIVDDAGLDPRLDGI